MSTARTRLLLTGILILGTSLLGCAPANEIPRSTSDQNIELTQGLDDETLSFLLESDKPAYLLGEPIVLTATLVNIGENPINVRPLLDPTYGYATYTITPLEYPSESFNPVRLDKGNGKLVTLQPQERVSDFVRIFVGSSGPTFGIPGTYVIEGSYHRTTSPPITLEILAPESEEDREAAALMLQNEVQLLLYSGGGTDLERAFANLRRLIDEFPASILSGYANYALGVYYSQFGRDFSADTIRRADPDLAISFFERSLGFYVSDYFRIQSFADMIDLFLVLNRTEAAIQYLALFESEYGESPLAQSNLELVRGKVEDLR